MTNLICIAAEAAPRTQPATRFITLAQVLLIAALVGACAAKTNTGATVAERSFGAGAQGTAAEGTTSTDGTTSADGTASTDGTSGGGSQAGAGERSAGAGSATGGRSGGGAAGSESAGGDSSLYGDSAADDDGTDDFTGIAGSDAAGTDGAGGAAGGAGPGGRSSSRTPGSSAASLGDDSGGGAGQDGTSAGGAAGGQRSAGGAGGGAGADGAMAGESGGAGGATGSEGGSGRAAAGGAGGQGGGGADGAVGAGSDQEAMVVGMVDAPGSRVRIDEEVTPQTLGGMLPLTVGVDEEGHFDFDRAVLRPEVKSVLDELAVRLRDAEWDRLDIMGYTDRIGTDDYNQQLSERRAWAVARYLMAQGIPVNKMRVEGRGERSSQVAQGECHDLERAELIACLQQDRRVEIEASIRKTEAKIQ